MTEGHLVSRGRGRRGDTADTHPENVPRMILKYFLNMIIFSGLTFGPAGQHVAEVDDSVGGVVVGDGRALPLPEADLVAEIATPGSGGRARHLLRCWRLLAALLGPGPRAQPRQPRQVEAGHRPAARPWLAGGAALKLKVFYYPFDI